MSKRVGEGALGRVWAWSLDLIEYRHRFRSSPDLKANGPKFVAGISFWLRFLTNHNGIVVFIGSLSSGKTPGFVEASI